MSAPPREKLYSPTLLALATQLAEYPLSEDFAFFGEARSRTCGSSVACGLGTDAVGAIETLGLRAAACAVGQASAAIFAEGAKGRDLQGIDAAHRAIEMWLCGDGMQPDWPRIEALEPALPFTGRHAAILLAWKAASEALSKPRVAS